MTYLQDPNHLLVFPVFKDMMENDMFLTYIGVRAHYGMSGKELLQACLEAWQLKPDKPYKLILVREGGTKEISLDKNIKEIGIRNGDPLQIVAA